ncbi:MAG TPA: hypothetical protein VGX51_11980 [Solirubrobacteraceae bacterium]|nr:hypothetical protein [Solirubrobacteraceae bacterium]
MVIFDSHRASKAAAANGAAAPARAGGLRLIAPSATAEEAAAIVAALERFIRDTAPTRGGRADEPDPWWRAGILEGTEHDAPGELREPWIAAPTR